MDQVIKEQLIKAWEDFGKNDYQSEYQYFKDNYSIEALEKLSVDEQAKRLFASRDYADENNICRGYFRWAEHGRKIDGESVLSFGKASTWSGGQDGPLIDKEGNSYYKPMGNKRSEKRERIDIDKNQLNIFAKKTFDALKEICEFTHSATLDSKNDYQELYNKIKKYLLSLNEPNLYWKSNGEPSAQLIKYLHCSFPEKFACWYSKGMLQKLLKNVGTNINPDDEAFILNSQLVEVAKNLEISDNANFGYFIGKFFNIKSKVNKEYSIDWTKGKLEVIKILYNGLKQFLQDTNLSVTLNTNAEDNPCINVYQMGDDKRHGFIYPKTRERKFELSFGGEILSNFKLKYPDSKIKPDKDDRTLDIKTIETLFSFEETIKVFENLTGKKKREYYPSIEEYDPEISQDFYYDYFNGGEVEKKKLDAIYCIYKLGGEASCRQLADAFGGEPNHYSNRAVRIAGMVHDKTGCPLYVENGKEEFWPVLFFGRKANINEEGSFVWKMRNPLYDAMKQLDEEDFFKEEAMNTKNIIEKNTILFGPPGTGKTYSTVIYAVAIVENKVLADVKSEAYEEVFERYKQYKEAGLIEFTTFHQSYGYEDFIEGIKPVMDDDESSDVHYEVAPGLFKTFCDKAVSFKKAGDVDYGFNESPVIWKVSLQGTGDNPVRSECLNNKHIRIGWDEYGKDLSGEIKEGRNVLNAFYSKMRKGDIVFSCYTASTIDAIGVVTGDPEWDDSYEDYKRVREVKWLVKGIKEDITKLNNNKTMTLSTIYSLNSISVAAAVDIIRKYSDNSVGDSLVVSNGQNYVFIIDEINRGNISKVFGELLTLIEPNKRIGAAEEARARLPYSKTLFGVPSNVYILGTMNTADRSIAMLDTALRRRFGFEEIMPNPDVLKGITVDGLDISNMLDRLNRKIKALFDREHTIGHAFFTPLKEDNSIDVFANIFRQKVFPLLQEYFYDDYGKIRLILGDGKKSEELQFIQIEQGYADLFAGEDVLIDETQYVINEDAFLKIDSYKSI